MTKQRKSDTCTVVSFPPLRQQQIDWLSLMHQQHTIHALLEIDVTHARQALKALKQAGGEPVSFTAFIVWCVARAIDAGPPA